MIERWYTTSATIKRDVWTNGKSSRSTVATMSCAPFQMPSEEYSNYTGLKFMKGYKVYCRTTEDVQEGDILEVGSDTLTVKYVVLYSSGENPHKELICEKA